MQLSHDIRHKAAASARMAQQLADFLAAGGAIERPTDAPTRTMTTFNERQNVPRENG